MEGVINIELLEDKMRDANVSVSELLGQIYERHNWVSNVDDRLRYKEYICPKDADETLDDWVRMYVNKKSRRVSYAGTKLKKVFLKLPGAEKRKVALALLTGGKEDTEWVCKRLKNYKESPNKEWEINWHPCYSKSIEECWNKYHGENCGLLFIQFLDEDIVREHLEEFTNPNDYFYICQRFVTKSWFKLDVDKLQTCTHINAYLSVMSQTKDGITEEEARRLLYQWIAIVLEYNGKRNNEQINENVFYSNKTKRIRVINAWGIDTALYYLLSMHLNNAVLEFLKWDMSIFNKYYFEEISEEGQVLGPNNDDFKQLVIETFPEDLKYLLYPNTRDYLFTTPLLQPFVKPRRDEFWLKLLELTGRVAPENPPMYLSPPDINTPPKDRFTLQEYNKLKENPLFQKLEERLSLSPLENLEHTDTKSDVCL